MMEKEQMLKIKGLGGKKTLSGSVTISGSKNAVLPAIASALLFKNPVRYTNVPDIEDVHRSFELLEALGCSVSPSKRHSVTITCSGNKTRLTEEISKRMRASILFVAPLLATRGEVTFPHPGGCVIGERPIDIFIDNFKKMGATCKESKHSYTLKTGGSGLKGAELFFRIQSVTGTSAFIMAGVVAKGETVIRNAAMEPEIIHLADFLNTVGAKITGAGTPTIRIRGTGMVRKNGATYVTPPDRLEAGSFLILGALAAKSLKIEKCNPEELHSLIERLELSGVSVKIGKHDLLVSAPKKTCKAVDIKTHEYPGFPTDLQAPMVVFLTACKGEAKVFETIFEGRLSYTEDLVRMGANINLWNQREATVVGPSTLRARELWGPDIRAGLAYVIAGIIAKGESTIHNVYYIDRGYENIEEKLQNIGVVIDRIKA
jgi:UDP-N-acetylglucosamine 1-carboxyvinyltransferase